MKPRPWWKNPWLWFGWPVAGVMVSQALIIRVTPASSWGGEPLRLGLFAACDLIVAGLQFWSYRGSLKYRRELWTIYRGWCCTCALYLGAEFPCSIHNPSKKPGDGEGAQ